MGVSSRLRDCFTIPACTHKSLLLVFLIGVTALVFLYMLPQSQPQPLPLPQPRRPNVSIVKSQVTILVWVYPFGARGTLPDCSARYRIDGCNLTDDKREYHQADGVIIHHRDIPSAHLPVQPRPPAQKWIWFNLESPTHAPGLEVCDNKFNLTMSYRRDSDIPLPYGHLVPQGVVSPLARPITVPSDSELVRPQLVAWVVSHWSKTHARVIFYNKLSKYIKVDVFGGAGRPLPRSKDSVIQLLRGYQFYLSLENSQHTDYITEKLWNAVLAGAIPVVLGPSRKNYEHFLPAEAFIHVDDFPTVQELANYLLKIKDNPAQLRHHLDWRTNRSVHMSEFWPEHFCMACQAVRRRKGQTDVVKKLSRWFRS
ncbi:uncharacterized protein V6R79_021172 [Siganus canaliculatus]